MYVCVCVCVCVCVRERVQNKQRKVWINQLEREGQPGQSKRLNSISSPFGEKKTIDYWRTMCLAGHKWRDVEIVGSMF